ncbi:polymorphic toxin-type HINT domain-containing protein [Paenibacillus massiliensis]|uniref:polymorphic toxin-type HINT domain-containing protein n=1 Tax=Paenibacillus massiliensis TaxID=225917 RepID=UPI0004BC4092|nr:polymorphic toxin-type HINT domain-containing protein [Paenibacillus massiliensis]
MRQRWTRILLTVVFAVILAGGMRVFTANALEATEFTLPPGGNVQITTAFDSGQVTVYHKGTAPSFDYVKLNKNGTLSTSAQYDRNFNAVILAGQQINLTNTSNYNLELTTSSKTKKLKFVTTSIPTFEKRMLPPGTSVAVTNLTSAAESFLISGLNDNVKFNDSGVLTTFQRDDKGGRTQLASGNRMVVTNRDTQTIEVSGANGVFSFYNSGPASFRERIGVGQTLEAINTENKTFYVYYESAGTRSYEYVVYNEDGSVSSSGTDKKVSDAIAKGKRLVVTNRGTGWLEVIGAYDAFTVTNENDPSMFRQILNNGESYKFTNTQARSLNLNIRGKYDMVKYEANGKEVHIAADAVSDSSIGYTVYSGQYVVVTNRNSSPVIVSGARDAYQVDRSAYPALIRRVVPVGGSFVALNQTQYVGSILINGTYDYARYDENGIKSYTPSNYVSRMEILGGERVAFTNTDTESKTIAAPYEMFRYLDRYNPVTLNRTLQPGDTLKLDNISARSFSVDVSGQHHYVTYTEGNRVSHYGNPIERETHSVTASEWHIVTNSGLSAMTVKAPFDAFSVNARLTPALFKGYVNYGESLKFKSGSSAVFNVDLNGTYDQASYRQDNGLRSMDRKTTSRLPLYPNERATVTNSGNTQLVLLAPYDVINAEVSQTPALAIRHLLADKSVEFVNRTAQSEMIRMTGIHDLMDYTADGSPFSYNRGRVTGYNTVSAGQRVAIMNRDIQPIDVYGAYEIFELKDRANPVTFSRTLQTGQSADFRNHTGRPFSIYPAGTYDFAKYGADRDVEDVGLQETLASRLISSQSRIALTNTAGSSMLVEGPYDVFAISGRQHPAVFKWILGPRKSMEATYTGPGQGKVYATGTFDHAMFVDGALDLYSRNDTLPKLVHKGERIAMMNTAEQQSMTVYGGYDVFETNSRANPVTFRHTLGAGEHVDILNKHASKVFYTYFTGVYDMVLRNADGEMSSLDYATQSGTKIIRNGQRIAVSNSGGATVTIEGSYDAFQLQKRTVPALAKIQLQPERSATVTSIGTADSVLRATGMYDEAEYDSSGMLVRYAIKQTTGHTFKPGKKLAVQNTDEKSIVFYGAYEDFRIESREQPVTFEQALSPSRIVEFTRKPSKGQLSLKMSGLYHFAEYKDDGSVHGFGAEESAGTQVTQEGNRIVLQAANSSPLTVRGPYDGFEIRNIAIPPVTIKTLQTGESFSIINVSPDTFSAKVKGKHHVRTYHATGELASSFDNTDYTFKSMKAGQRIVIINPGVEPVIVTAPTEAILVSQGEELAVKRLGLDETVKVANTSAAPARLALTGTYDIVMYNAANQPVSYTRGTGGASQSIPANHYAIVTGKQASPTIIQGNAGVLAFTSRKEPALRIVTANAESSYDIKNRGNVSLKLSVTGTADWVRLDSAANVTDYKAADAGRSYNLNAGETLRMSAASNASLELWGPYDVLQVESKQHPALTKATLQPDGALKITNVTDKNHTLKAEGAFAYRVGKGEEQSGRSPLTVSSGAQILVRSMEAAPYLMYSPYGLLRYEDGTVELEEAISGEAAAEQISKLDPSQYDPATLYADPVDTATGAQIINRTLLSANGAVPVPFQAQYYSLLGGEGALGKGWSHNYELKVQPVADGRSVEVFWNAFRRNTFVLGADGTYTSQDPSVRHDVLSRQADGTFTLVRNQGTTLRFAADGLPMSIEDRGGMKLQLDYSAARQLIAVTEPVTGQGLTFAYNSAGDIVTVADTAGRQVGFTYDRSGRLNSITDAAGRETTYTYNADHRIDTAVSEGAQLFTNIYDDKGRIVTQSDAEGATTTFAYEEKDKQLITTITDRNGRQQQRTHSAKYELLQVLDALGRTTSYAYDDRGNRTSVTNTRGQTVIYTYDAKDNLKSAVDHTGQTITLSYDERDNLKTVTGPDGKQVKYTYDGQDRLLSVIDSENRTTAYAYDTQGFLQSATDALGNKTAYAYTGGRLTKLTTAVGEELTFLYDEAGRMSGVRDEEGNETTSVYNAADELLSYTDPLGHTYRFAYDSQGFLSQETDGRGLKTQYTYDGNGNLLQMTDAAGGITAFAYDREGRMVSAMDALGNKSTFAYDAVGNVISETNPLGEKVRYVYDDLNRVTEAYDALNQRAYAVTYDAIGNPVATTDALGQTYTSQYDKLSRLTGSIDPLSRKTIFTYDDLNRLTSVQDPMEGVARQSFDALNRLTQVTDPNQNTASYTYDAVGRVTRETDAAGGVHTYKYNAIGLLAQETNKRGQNVDYAYDAAGQLTKFTDPDGSVAYSYDANGNVTAVTDQDGQTIRREYDALNRVKQYTDEHGNTIKYTYDAVGQLTALTYPDGKQVSYTYDAAGRMRTVTDWAGRKTTYTYNANGQVISTQRPDGSEETRTYDANGQLLSSANRGADGNLLTSYAFSYDAVGNVVSETGGVQGTVPSEVTFDVYGPGLSPAPEEGLGAELNGTDPTAVTSDVYPLEMTYTVDNRLATVNGEPVIYDADGNMTTGPLQGNMQSYEYDSRNRLQSAGGVSYGYNAENMRTSVTTDGNTVRYVINPNAALSQVLMESDADGKPLAYYVYGLGLLGREDASGEYQTYHYDRRGSTVAMTALDGTITDTYEYGPYGEQIGHEGATEQPFRYNGRDGVMTDANGLYHMRARYYSPDIKRFINRDVVTGTISDTPTLNRYAYVNGNPISYIDPFGLSRDGDSLMLRGGDMLLDLVPGVGALKGFQQAFTGVNLVTGEKLSVAERWMEGIGSAIGLIPIPGSKAIGKYGVEGAVTLGKKAKGWFGKGKVSKVITECNCFSAGTKVLTDDGEKPIEDIQVGDKVLAKSDETGEVAYKEVVGLFQKQADEIYYVHVGDEIIEVTGEHPFWLDGRGWTYVKDLKVGDLLISSDGTKLAIDKIEKESREATVYNFEVEDYHSYFVSNLGIWVHNCDISPSPQQLLGIKLAGNIRSSLNEKVPRDTRLGPGSKRHLTVDEKKIANQHINDLMASKYGDNAAVQRLSNYRPHLRDDGWWSLDLATDNGASNIMRLLYREVNGAIEWKVIQNH